MAGHDVVTEARAVCLRIGLLGRHAALYDRPRPPRLPAVFFPLAVGGARA